MNNQFKELREFFKTGNTFGYDFRIKQLEILKKALEGEEENILEALRLDVGKPQYEAYTSEIGLLYEEINRALAELKTWMSEEKVATPIYLKPAVSYIRPVPKGLVLIISPWNYPFLLSFSPLIGAIAAGNCAVIKPSSKTKKSSQLITRIIEENFDSNYIAVVNGPGGEVVDDLIVGNAFNHIFFTGSVAVGKHISRLASQNLTPLTLELGGKSPAIVDDTVNIDLASKKIIWAKLFNLGQTCIAPDYLIIDRSVKEEFIEKSIENILKFYGDKIQDNPDYGRIIDDRSFMRLAGLIQEDRLIYGGERDREDLYIGPCLVEASLEDEIMQEEIFGPILPIITIDDTSQIRDIIEENPSPLALYLFTEDEALRELIINGVQFGGGCINDTMSHMINTALPFGGIETSGSGRYHSKYSFDEFSHFKALVESKSNLDIDVKYPPYSKGKLRMSKFFLK